MPARYTQSSFIERVREIHGDDAYDYSLIVYKGCSRKVMLKCSKHGVFLMRSDRLLVGYGCKKCRRVNLQISRQRAKVAAPRTSAAPSASQPASQPDTSPDTSPITSPAVQPTPWNDDMIDYVYTPPETYQLSSETDDYPLFPDISSYISG